MGLCVVVLNIVAQPIVSKVVVNNASLAVLANNWFILIDRTTIKKIGNAIFHFYLVVRDNIFLFLPQWTSGSL
jgi:hypothetical protein